MYSCQNEMENEEIKTIMRKRNAHLKEKELHKIQIQINNTQIAHHPDPTECTIEELIIGISLLKLIQ